MRRRSLFLLIIASILLASCKDESNITRQKLVGKWLEESTSGGVQTRSIIILELSGAFIETEKTIETDGVIKQDVHSGEWSFDGINFKRMYTNLNNKPLSNAQFRYATYAVKSLSEIEFFGLDNIRAKEIRFSRTKIDRP
jgi:hypothetical protein